MGKKNKPMMTSEVRGLVETEEKLLQVSRDLHGPKFTQAMQNATLIVTRDAKKFAPVDMGQLKNSITGTVRSTGNTITGVVGSNLEHAPYMELGTKPHWPPISAIEVWARRHGIDPFLVARAISIRGTKARKFLERAYDKNKDWIVRRLNLKVGEIISDD